MITFKNFQTIHGNLANPGRARKMESDTIMLNTWWQDIQSQTAYLYDIYHDTGDERFKLNDLHPEENEDKIPISIKFIRHASQTYNKDPITFWLQLQPGQECNVDYYDEMFASRYNATWPVGLYIDIADESGKYNKWLIVNTANSNQNQFPTFELLRCDYLFQWIHNGKRYECPGVLQSQNSYNSGLWTDYKLTAVEDQQRMALPMSAITETLYYNHRLLVDSFLYNEDSEPRAWLVSKVKRISPNGIAVITMAQDVFDQHQDYIERDSDGNILGMWANYYKSNLEPVPVNQEESTFSTAVTARIVCSGKPQLKVGGSAKTFTVAYYDVNGNVLPAFNIGQWSFTIDGERANDLITVTEQEDAHKIKVEFLGGDDYIGKVLTVTNNSNGIISSLDVEIIPL